MTQAVFTPAAAASATTAWPTALPAQFCTTRDPLVAEPSRRRASSGAATDTAATSTGSAALPGAAPPCRDVQEAAGETT